jgi:hypothetical protein
VPVIAGRRLEHVIAGALVVIAGLTRNPWIPDQVRDDKKQKANPPSQAGLVLQEFEKCKL